MTIGAPIATLMPGLPMSSRLDLQDVLIWRKMREEAYDEGFEAGKKSSFKDYQET
jgi:hypothetical protein